MYKYKNFWPGSERIKSFQIKNANCKPFTYIECQRHWNTNCCVLLIDVIQYSLKMLPVNVTHNKIKSNVSYCFHLYLLCRKNNIWQQNTFLFKIVWKCNLSPLGFCQLFHFGCITPSCQKHQEWTNVLLGLSTTVGEWSVSSTADYIILLAHLSLTGSTSRNEKTKCWNNLIWFT